MARSDMNLVSDLWFQGENLNIAAANLKLQSLNLTLGSNEDRCSHVRRRGFVRGRRHFAGAGPRTGRLYDAAVEPAPRDQCRRKWPTAAFALLLTRRCL